MSHVGIRGRCRQGLNKKLFTEEADFELGLEVRESAEEGVFSAGNTEHALFPKELDFRRRM